MKRKSRGFLQTGGILKNRIREASESRGFAESRLLTHWSEIAGASVAKICSPVKVSYTKQGIGATLNVLTTGANAPMLQMQLPQIIRKVNSVYGYNAISRITITQTAPTGFAESTKKFDHKPPTKELSQDQIKEIEFSLKDVSDDNLKQALAKLGKNIKSKQTDKG